MSLPFTDARPAIPSTGGRQGAPSTGDQSWTLFVNAANFKGPVAFYLPETWSKISANYPFDDGRGLDARPGRAGGGAIEINTVPHFVASDKNNTVYTKIPELQFPVDAQGRTVLVREVKFYSKDALYNDFKSWRDGGEAINGSFDLSGAFVPTLSTRPVQYRQDKKLLEGVNELLTPTIFDSEVFGLQWNKAPSGKMASFPQYFKETGDKRIAIRPDEVPREIHLRDKAFTPAKTGTPYILKLKGSWTTPGPAKGPYTAKLADGSTVTYYWYRFVDQPAFQQFNRTLQEKEKLQAFVERIHRHWSINGNYMPPPKEGKLVSFDPALILTPPPGLEVGYVPVATGQERK